MAKKWSEVEKSEAYQLLSPEEKTSAKQEYWDNVISQKEGFNSLSEKERSLAQQEFFTGKLPQAQKMVGVFGKVPEEEFLAGRRNIMGNISERPAAAIRSALQGQGYTAGAINPTNVPNFQDLLLRAYYEKTPNFAGKTLLGNIPSAVGLGADILTNPADMALLLLPKVPVGGGKSLGQAVMSTSPAQSFQRWLTKERQVSNLTKHFPKAMTDN